MNATLPEPDDSYYAFFIDGAKVRASKGSPPDIVPPSNSADGSINRTRGVLREHVLSLHSKMSLVVGRSIVNDIVDLRRQAALMALAGAAVAGLGLIGGWWVASGAIKPIKAIGATASKIAEGNLSERINVPNTDSELGQLAVTLNTTFERLHTAYAQLQAAFKRQTDFTADASHELRTPASVILAETTSVLARERTVDEYKESLESIQRSARRLRQLTESLLTLARLDSVHSSERRICDVNAIAHEITMGLGPLALQHQITLSEELANAPAIGNPEQIGQIITNLLSNAIYYNRPGGAASIRVLIDGGNAVIAVSDNGVGIGSDDLPQIFERFYRADKSRSRSNGRVGLGLAITKAIVEAHKGSIAVSSEPGKGSSFTVRLPK